MENLLAFFFGEEIEDKFALVECGCGELMRGRFDAEGSEKGVAFGVYGFVSLAVADTPS